MYLSTFLPCSLWHTSPFGPAPKNAGRGLLLLWIRNGFLCHRLGLRPFIFPESQAGAIDLLFPLESVTTMILCEDHCTGENESNVFYKND